MSSFGGPSRPDRQHDQYSDWSDADGFTPAGGLHFDENSLILGYSVALGSGNGTADIYLKVDGVTMDFTAELERHTLNPHHPSCRA